VARRPRRRRWWLTLIAFFVKLGAVLAILGGLGLWGLDRYLDGQLPDVLSVDSYRHTVPQTTRVYAASGEVIGVFRTERRTLVRLADLPGYVPAALIAAEDRDFYSHEGLDYLAMLRAMLVNLRDGRPSQGASTLTQQLARSFYLTADKTLERKLLEVFLARKLDRHLSKDEVLELYLNQVYFGEGRWGIEEAAQHYFGKRAAELELGEAAVLVAVLPAPERLNPFADLDGALVRRRRVLSALADAREVPPQAAAAAAEAPLWLAPRQLGDPREAPWFLDAVRRRLEPALGAGTLMTAGLRVHTTLDPAAQRALDAAVAAAGAELEGAEVAAALIEASSRRVLAVVGGLDFDRSPFNRAVQARRQVGSAFKPFIYAAAFEAGLVSPESVVSNAPMALRGRGGAWRPRNAVPGGPSEVTVGDALVRSLNLPAVRVLRRTGLGAVTDLARRAGLRSAIPSDLTAALGSGTVTVLELANAYATFATGGVAGSPVLIARVEDAEGRLLYSERQEAVRAMPAEVARSVSDLLARAVSEGTGRRAQVSGARVAGKTGTTDGGRDAWFVGFAGDLVLAVWVGRDDATPMEDRTGGRTAAPIFGAAMAQILGAGPAEPGRAAQGR